MKTTLACLVAILLLLSVMPGNARAMGGMYTAKYIDGSNLILMTHNVHNTQSGTPVTYNIRIYDMEGRPITFGNVQVELLHGKQSILSQNLRRSVNNDTSFEYTFPKQGSYVLAVKFMDNDKQIAQGEFPIVVARGASEGFFANAFTTQTAVAFGLGVGAAAILQSRGHLKALYKKKKHITTMKK